SDLEIVSYSDSILDLDVLDEYIDLDSELSSQSDNESKPEMTKEQLKGITTVSSPIRSSASKALNKKILPSLYLLIEPEAKQTVIPQAQLDD
ncbi:DNA translocase FtsK, partial [Francisella tularensis subsp. holarctica]|nr:DNA translocase FtsK [Francisella tularensis subsp. holarctica]